jgi:hypothetical protein
MFCSNAYKTGNLQVVAEQKGWIKAKKPKTLQFIKVSDRGV